MTTTTKGTGHEHHTEMLDRVVIRFAGDSGDGMQLTGDRFTTSSALLGNDLATFPDFPAEIRAPAGTLAGVSAFQVHISDHDILTPGDVPNVLVAMNPAALKANLGVLPKGASILVNVDAFDERNLAKAGYEANPLTDGSLGAYIVYEVPMTSITQEVCKEAGVKPRDAERSKNFFALGLVSWLYTRPTEPTIEWIGKRFADKPAVAEANTRAFRAGFDFGETAELFESNYEVRPATFEKGEYVQVTGNRPSPGGSSPPPGWPGCRCSWAATRSPRPRTSSTSCRRRKEFGVRTFQAEDEIAGVGAALGAAFGGVAGGDHHQRAGPRPQVRDHRPGRQPGAAAGHRRRPARRPLDRPADQDRAGRPPPRHVRAPRRGAAAHRGRLDALGLLLRRHRGGADRRQVPHPGHPALRRVPGQRGRAVAAARPRRPRADRPGLRHLDQPHRARRDRGRSGPTCATR